MISCKSVFLLFSVAVVSLWFASPAQADWIGNGVPLCTDTGVQDSPIIVPDGAGGAVVIWMDHRSSSWDIYAQRVDATGAILWTTDGVAVCTATGGIQSALKMKAISDGAGGAIIAWQDIRIDNWDIYAQRVDASGVVQWAAGGLALCTDAAGQYRPGIASDGAGGAIVTWDDYRSGTGDIYAQRVNSLGAVQWTADGIPICTATAYQLYPTIASDSAGGAIITWQDYRNGTWDIYSQRVNSSGSVQWTADGVVVCTATGNQVNPTIALVGTAGAVITWIDGRGADDDVYAQRVNASGVVQWTADGVALCAATGVQEAPMIVSDGAGGAIVEWGDQRSGNADVYSQRVDSVGTVQWMTDGVLLCTATGDQEDPTIVSDGEGGAIVTWWDGRNAPNYDIYAQRVNASGALQWTADGLGLCTAAGNQERPTIATDGAGGAIVTWMDSRSGNPNIYAQHVTHLGNIGDDYVPVSLVAIIVIALAIGSLGLCRMRRKEVIAA